jgi:hypothetical protein
MELPVKKFLTKLVGISKEFGAPQPKLKFKMPSLSFVKETLV